MAFFMGWHKVKGSNINITSQGPFSGSFDERSSMTQGSLANAVDERKGVPISSEWHYPFSPE